MEAPPSEAFDVPSLSQIITYCAYAVGVAAAVVITRLGFVQGQRSPERGTDRAEIAGAVISDKKADEIVDALRANTDAVEANMEALERMREEVRDTRKEMAELRLDFRLRRAER